MKIDWFTTVAQAVNFLVLMAILKFLLFDRIVAAIDAREEKLRSDREEVEADRNEARAEKDRAHAIREEVEETRKQRMREARDAADEHRMDLEKRAHDEAERARERFRASLRDEQRQLVSTLVRTAAEGVSAAARRALEDLTGIEIEGRIVSRLCEKLGQTDDLERDQLREAWASLDTPLLVRSGRPLSHREQERLGDALSTAMKVEGGHKVELALHFEISDELACGIEISGGGYSVGWSIRSYLAEIEERIEDELSEEEQRESGQAQEEATEAEGIEGEQELEDELLSEEPTQQDLLRANEGNEGNEGDRHARA